MTIFAREKVRMALHHNEDGLHQALLNIAYDEWQKQKSWSMEDMLKYAGSFGEIIEFAVLLGKYNQQVTNGGHSQYFDNGYSGSHPQDDYDYNTPLARRLEELMLKYQLNETSRGCVVADCVRDFINRTHAWNVNEHDPDENGDVLMPSYDDLDDAYFQVSDAWMLDLERYFKLWMEHNENPIPERF